ncbi:recombinase family protein [Pseudoroseicyclus sp. H15]
MAALKAYGVPEELIFVDRASGSTLERPMFVRVLKYAQHPGTELVVWNLDCLARTLEGILWVLNFFERRGVKLFSLTERVDLTTPMGKAMLQIMGVVAEPERNLIIERTNVGLARARERGEKGGRPIAMTPGRVEVADQLLRDGELGPEVRAAVKALPGPPVSRAAYYAWQKKWKAGEVGDVGTGESFRTVSVAYQSFGSGRSSRAQRWVAE